MDEAQELADRVAVISAGQIVAEGPPETLAGREMSHTIVRFRLPERAPALPRSLKNAAKARDGHVEIEAADPIKVLHDLTGWALEKKVALEELEVARPTLEDVYLKLTGAEAEGAE
jgi:ABC-2 type transport system ATP-binding protein